MIFSYIKTCFRNKTRSKEYTNRVKEWFDSGEWSQHCSPDDVARNLGLTRYELNTCCKKLFGKPFIASRNTVRIESAQEIIAMNPNYTSSMVASMCGFSDRRNFEHYFEERYGITPATYRQRFKAKMKKR